MIGCILLFIFFGFCDWYGHGWFMTRFSKVMLTGAAISAFMYCFVVILIPDYFTYNGTTAIFLSLNYIFVTLMLFELTSGNANASEKDGLIKVSILVEAIANLGISDQNQSDQEKTSSLIRFMQEVFDKNREYFKTANNAFLAGYVLTFISYFIIILLKNPGS